MKNVFKYALFALLLGTYACDETLKPEGKIVGSNVEIPLYATGIEVSGGAILTLDASIPVGTAVVYTHENIQQYVVLSVMDDKAHIFLDTKNYITNNLELKISVSMEQFHTFVATGGSIINCSGSLSLLNGTFDISGGSNVSFTGSCENANITASGGSLIRAFNLATTNLKINASGGSNVEVSVSDVITGDLSGGSNLYYKGDPIVRVESTGASNIEKK